MKWILLVLGGLMGLVALVVIVGMLLPVGHVASVRVRLHQSQEAVWKVLTDFENHPSWRSGLTKMERLSDRDGLAVWREEGKFGPLTYEITEQQPSERMVTTIADPGLPYGGSWTYEIAPEGEGCSVTITERGEVKNPVFRFMSRFVFGHHATAEAYLGDLAGRFGEEASPERIEPAAG